FVGDILHLGVDRRFIFLGGFRFELLFFLLQGLLDRLVQLLGVFLVAVLFVLLFGRLHFLDELIHLIGQLDLLLFVLIDLFLLILGGNRFFFEVQLVDDLLEFIEVLIKISFSLI